MTTGLLKMYGDVFQNKLGTLQGIQAILLLGNYQQMIVYTAVSTINALHTHSHTSSLHMQASLQYSQIMVLSK